MGILLLLLIMAVNYYYLLLAETCIYIHEDCVDHSVAIYVTAVVDNTIMLPCKYLFTFNIITCISSVRSRMVIGPSGITTSPVSRPHHWAYFY